jgi:uncharacterized protein YutE (UPF0331/DUF86 family)
MISISKESRERLIKHIDFLEAELEDYPLFARMTWKEYKDIKEKRRNVERWIENIVNSSIDLAKIILSAEGISIPETYRETLLGLGGTKYFNERFGRDISRWSYLRNIVAHQYLDIRWDSIKKFIAESQPVYSKLVKVIKGKILKHKAKKALKQKKGRR